MPPRELPDGLHLPGLVNLFLETPSFTNVGDAAPDEPLALRWHAHQAHLAEDVAPEGVLVSPLETGRLAVEGPLDLLSCALLGGASIGLGGRANGGGIPLVENTSVEREECLRLRVHFDEAPQVGVDDHESFRGVLEKRPVARLAEAQAVVVRRLARALGLS